MPEPSNPIANLMFTYGKVEANIWLTNDHDENHARVLETIEHIQQVIMEAGSELQDRRAYSGGRGGGGSGGSGRRGGSVTQDWTENPEGCVCSKCGQPGYTDPRPTKSGKPGMHKCKNRECMETPPGFDNPMYFGIHWPEQCPGDPVNRFYDYCRNSLNLPRGRVLAQLGLTDSELREQPREQLRALLELLKGTP